MFLQYFLTDVEFECLASQTDQRPLLQVSCFPPSRDHSKVNWIQRFQFSGPFNPNEPTNEMSEEVRAKANQVWQNPEVQNAVQHFAQLFQGRCECLLHGNLSTYSVLSKDGVVKVRRI